MEESGITENQIQQYFIEHDDNHYKTRPPDSLTPIESITPHPNSDVFAFQSTIVKAEYTSIPVCFSAMVSRDLDGRLLWLDDPEKHQDFSAFVRNERLFEHLPNAPRVSAEILLATKFNYLDIYQPRIIESIFDIPGFPQYLLMIPKLVRRHFIRLENIVMPPAIQREGELHRISFTTWTRVGGRIRNFICIWNRSMFSCKEDLIYGQFGERIFLI